MSFRVALALLLTSAALAPPQAASADLHVVPIPKQAIALNQQLPLARAAIVLGKQATAQDKIAAGYINEKLAELGAPELPLCPPATPPAEGPRIYLGTPQSNPALAKLLLRYGVKVTPDDPGPQGYVVHFALDETPPVVLLAGSDPQGALYAAATFRMLLEGRGKDVRATAAQIRDWPDFLKRMCGRYDRYWGILSVIRKTPPDSPSLEKYVRTFVERNKRRIDWCVNNKINWISLRSLLDCTYVEQQTDAVRRALREVTDYGRVRGVFFEAAGKSAIDVGQWQGPNRPSWADEIVHTHGVGYCWSRLDEVRRRARLLAQFARDIGASAYYLHSPDTRGGGFDRRCPLCRKNFTDADRPRADAAVMNIFAEEIERLVPGCLITAVLVPYGATLDRMAPEEAEATLAYWRKANELLRPEIYICVRENRRVNLKAFREAYAGRRIYFYNEPITWRGWVPLNATSCRFAKTGFFGVREDFYYVGSRAEDELTWRALVNNYAWNVNAPGADWQRKFTFDPQIDCSGPPQVVNGVLRAVCINEFGAEIGPLVAEAESQLVCWNYLTDTVAVTNRMEDLCARWEFHGEGYPGWVEPKLANIPQFLDMIRRGSTRACELLGRAWAMAERGEAPLTAEQRERLAYVYSIALSCRALSSAMYAAYAAENAAARGEYEKCGALAREGLANMEQLIAPAQKLLEQVGERVFKWQCRNVAELTRSWRPRLERLAALSQGYVVEDVDTEETLKNNALIIFHDSVPGLRFVGSGNGTCELTTKITRHGSKAAIAFTKPERPWAGCGFRFDPIDISKWIKAGGHLRFYINSMGPEGFQQMTFWMILTDNDEGKMRWKWVRIDKNNSSDGHPGYIIIDSIPATWQLVDIPLADLCPSKNATLSGFRINFARVPKYGIVIDDIYLTGSQPTVERRYKLAR